ncbi:MAG: segregation/condensation protein A [candidate division KSB1 bacterium]|nr:segregation/condensation protein A [candidate division KSB1 bacterium]MDQ7063146.1 segregation/condensation protein A [candidate division KSB1 bacterium]
MIYRVQLENFEGPLDLLLYLIKKNEVDLFNIPISEITRQYLEYIEIIQMLDLEGASDFILMAATLIRIKAKMLLPKPPVDMDEEEEEDPREELVRRLLEYQRFKEVAIKMADYESQRQLLYTRRYFDQHMEPEPQDWWDPKTSYTLFDLMWAFKEILQKAPKVTQHSVEQIPVTIDDQIGYILRQLDQNEGQLLFYELLEKLKKRIIMIVTFLSLLELIRRGEVEVTQSSTFGEIWVRRKRWTSLN